MLGDGAISRSHRRDDGASERAFWEDAAFAWPSVHGTWCWKGKDATEATKEDEKGGETGVDRLAAQAEVVGRTCSTCFAACVAMEWEGRGAGRCLATEREIERVE